MATYSKSGYFGWAGGGKDGAVVDMWLQSRFTGIPAFNDAPPSGNPDGGPIVTGPTYGGHGAFIVQVSVLDDYFLRAEYGGESYWTEVPANVLQGSPVGGGGGITVVTGDETSIDVLNGNTIPLISLLAGTGDVIWPPSSTNTTLVGTSNVNTVVGALPSITALAPSDNPDFTGIPTAPTQSPGDNSTAIATTAYVYTATNGPVTIGSIGGTYTIGLGDTNTEIEVTSGSPSTITINPNSTTAYPNGFSVNLRQMGAGQVTVAGGVGVTVVGSNGLKTRTQYSTISLIQSNTTNTWVVGGDSTP